MHPTIAWSPRRLGHGARRRCRALSFGIVLVLTAPLVATASEDVSTPRVCWRHLAEPPAGLSGRAGLRAAAGEPLRVSDGAHPAVSLRLPGGGEEGGEARSRLTTRGVHPQLFVGWPGGRLTWIWAREPRLGMRYLRASLAPAAPTGCVARGDGGPALVVEAVAEGGRRTCVAWPIAAGAGGGSTARPSVCLPAVVPRLIGKTLAEARSILEDHDLAVGVIQQRPAAQPIGVVVEQDPAAGSGAWLATGDGVDLVTASVQLVAVPSLVGRSVGAARSVLAPLGLGLAPTSAGSLVEAAGVSDYDIDSQDPEPGGSLAVGDQVTAEVSLRLPDLRGLPVGAARTELRRLGLEPSTGDLERLAPEAAAIYRVGAHRPPGGEPVRFGGRVEIEARTSTPNLRGLTPARARRRLRASGLEMRRRSAPPPDAASERVRRQRPAAGDELAPGSEVAVTLGVLAPDIQGATLAEARRRLVARGLRLRLGDDAAEAVEPPDSVAHRLRGQRPRPGTLVGAGSPITASLEIQLPNLLWRDAFEAETFLSGLGMAVPRPRPRMAGSLRQHVVSQSPPAGTWQAVGTPVQLTLGPGVPPPSPTPRWPWLALLLVAILGGSLLRPRLRRRPRRLHVEGHTDFGKPVLATEPAAAGPPAVGLRPRWDPGRQTLEIARSRKGDTGA